MHIHRHHYTISIIRSAAGRDPKKGDPEEDLKVKDESEKRRIRQKGGPRQKGDPKKGIRKKVTSKFRRLESDSEVIRW